MGSIVHIPCINRTDILSTIKRTIVFCAVLLQSILHHVSANNVTSFREVQTT